MRAALAAELAEMRRIARHYRPLRRLARQTATIGALALFLGGLGAVAIGYTERAPVASAVMIAEAR